MAQSRPELGTPVGVEGPWLAAILGVLDDIADTLRDRLPSPAMGGGQPAPVAEPAAPEASGAARPVREPAPVVPPEDSGPAEAAPPPSAPPRAGRGSSLDAWRGYADAVGVTYPADAGRDDIIAACARAGVLT